MRINWVAREYLRRCKSGASKETNTVEALKYWNLAIILEAHEVGKPEPRKPTMSDVLKEGGYGLGVEMGAGGGEWWV